MADALRAIRDRREFWLCILAALALFSCASPEQSAAKDIKVAAFPSRAEAHAVRVRAKLPSIEKYDHPVTNSGYQGYAFGSRTVAWIDNDRALFLSNGPLLKSGEPRRSASTDLYLWDTRSGTIKKYATSVSGFCFAEGMLRYWGETGRNFFEYAGSLGEERKRVYAEADFPPRNGWHLNPHTCNYYRDEALPKGKGVFYRPLREGDGYLGGGRGLAGNFSIFLPDGGNEYRRLPLPTRASPITYSQLARAYVLRETPPVIQKDSRREIRFWLFRPDLVNLEPIVVPAGPWLKGYLILVSPTPAGVVFASATAGKSDATGRPTTGAGGVYLLASGHARRIMAGYPFSAAITPSGCRVLVSMAPRFMADMPAAVEFVDLCSKDR